MIHTFIHILILLIFPPLLPGVVNKTKALFAGRTGAPFFQLYYDIFKLMIKGMVISSTTTWVFTIAPVIALSCVLIAGLIIPIGNAPSCIFFTGDFLVFTYLFGLARFFTTAAALDTGSAFEGMGSSREVTFASLTEPALFFAFIVLVKLTGSLNLSGMVKAGSTIQYHTGSIASLVMIILGLYILFLAENSRIPVDDPNTHLELTMIHEVMVLDHSGPLLGIIEYASAMKFFVIGSILINIVISIFSMTGWINYIVFIASMLILSFVVGVTESIMARLKMSRVPSLLISSILLCGSSFIILLR